MKQRGFTYLWTLMSVALLGIALAVTGSSWRAEMKRDRERQLIRNAMQYVHAIESYYKASPGISRELPRTVEDLLEDRRFIGVRRHLRRLYGDPVRKWGDFEYVQNASGKLIGVRSKSLEKPIRQAEWTDGVHTVDVAACYCKWLFLARLDN